MTMQKMFATIAFCVMASAALADPALRNGPDICRGRVWVKNLINIHSEIDWQADPMFCWADPATKVGKRILAVCNEWGGTATHGCWLRGTFKVDKDGLRAVTGVFEIQKIDIPEEPY